MRADYSNDDFDFRFRCEKQATKVFGRLHSLVQAGYVPDFDSEFVEAFWLRHPSNRFKHNRLTIYPSGLVLSSNENTDEFRFYLDDEAQFRHFLRQVPRPSWWDRYRESWITIRGGREQ